MSLKRDVILKKFPGLFELIKVEKSKLNLKPLNKVTVRFDPFNNGVSDIRRFTSSLFERDVYKTNPKCIIKTEILTDRSESHIIFDLVDQKKFIFKCANLKLLEIYQLMNEHITPLAPVDDVTTFETVKMKKK